MSNITYEECKSIKEVHDKLLMYIGTLGKTVEASFLALKRMYTIGFDDGAKGRQE